MAKFLRVTMPDGDWDIPIEVIARSRAAHYADEFGGDAERSLAEDTMPLFEDDKWVATEWASNQMYWSDVAKHAIRVFSAPKPINYEMGWMNGAKKVIEK